MPMKPAEHTPGLIAVGTLLAAVENMLALQFSNFDLSAQLIELFLEPAMVPECACSIHRILIHQPLERRSVQLQVR